ncbi:hypothetical protein JCM21900_001783 [Sporobolomyces salmonicolor]
MVAPAVQYPRTDFPEDLECHPLLVVDYEKVAAGDEKEIDVLYSACTNLGFFYLKNFGFEDLTEPMFEVGSATFSLPEEDLLPFEQGDSGMSAGYKRGGSTNVDAKGNVDTIQFINVAKDDAFAYPEVRQRTYPPTVVERMNTVTSFIRKSDDCLQTVMAALEPRIGLPKGTLAALHKEGDISGSESRCILKPAPGDKGYLPEGVGEDGNPSAALGAHTDFGSLSMLHGRGCGGLQVLPPGTSKWQHIRPLPGHAVCNVGDTLSVYSGNIFKSNIHRVIPPPPPQDTSARWSLVYFLRPGFNNDLRPLAAESAIIAGHAAQDPAMQSLPKGATAGEWFKRRVSKQRAANRKGPETWAESRGTEPRTHPPSMIVSTSARLLSRTLPAPPACSACRVHRRSAHKLVEIQLTTDVPALGRRGDRLPISPGRARNQLIPAGQALYVVRGKAVSALGDMARKELERQTGLMGSLAQRRAAEAEERARRVLEGLSEAVGDDSQEPLRASERTLLSALALVPQPLSFTRRTTSATSSDLFGSVSVSDVVAALREQDVRIEESAGTFVAKAGVEKGRVKKVGTFELRIQFRALEETYGLRIEVAKE